MVGKTARRTKSDNERIEFVKLYMGCLPCILCSYLDSHADYHHVVEGQRRLGHEYGYGACAWHHKGICWEGFDRQDMNGRIGPSMAHGKKPYRAVFGRENLLVETVNFAHKFFLKWPWDEFAMPLSTGTEIRRFHMAKQMKAT